MQKLLTLIGMLAIAGAAHAEPPVIAPAAAQNVAEPRADPFAQAMAARGVAEFARRQKDPLAMVLAARMLGEIAFSGPADADAAFTPAGLFDEARTLAKGDQTVLMQIHIAQSTAPRGVISSPFGRGLVRSVQALNPRAQFGFTVAAKGGDTLRMGAIGDLGTNLLMRIQDPAGRTVCVDDHGDYAPVCQLTPRANGQYRVDIVNKSAARSRAVILSN